MPLTTREKVSDLLEHMAYDNPPPDGERWISNAAFDPPFGRTELNAALRQKLIELDASNPDHLNWRFRFTPQGRLTLEKKEEK